MSGRFHLCVAALIFAASQTHAQTEEPSGFYFTDSAPSVRSRTPSLRAESAPPEASPQTTRSFATGYDFGRFRTEIERYRSFGLSDPVTGTQIDTNTVMFNGMYDIMTGPRLKTFVGAGFGAVNQTQRIPGASNDEWASAYQLRGGVTYDITRAVRGLLEFRQQGGFFAGSSARLTFKQRGVVLGLRYQLQ